MSCVQMIAGAIALILGGCASSTLSYTGETSLNAALPDSSGGARTELSQDAPDPPAEDKIKKEKVTLGTGEKAEEFELEVAADSQSRAQGLMYRTKLDAHGGMIFIYRTADTHSFWMANCLIDIELIYLDPKGKIVATHKMKKEEPRRPGEPRWRYEDRLKRYRSVRPAQYAIEVKPGTIDRLTIKRGDVIELEFERLTKMAK